MSADIRYANDQAAYFRAQLSVKNETAARNGTADHWRAELARWERIAAALGDAELLDTMQTRGLLATPPFDSADTWLIEDVRVPVHESYEGATLRDAIRVAQAGQVPT